MLRFIKEKETEQNSASFLRNKTWVRNMYAAMLNKKLVLAVNEAYLVNNKQKKLNQDNYRCPSVIKK